MKSHISPNHRFTLRRIAITIVTVVMTAQSVTFAQTLQQNTEMKIQLPQVKYPEQLITYRLVRNNSMAIFTQVGTPAAFSDLRPRDILSITETPPVIAEHTQEIKQNNLVTIVLTSRSPLPRPTYDSVCVLRYIAGQETVVNMRKKKVENHNFYNSNYFQTKEQADNFAREYKLHVDSYTMITSINDQSLPTFRGHEASKFNLWCMHKFNEVGLDGAFPAESSATFNFTVSKSGELDKLRLVTTNNPQYAQKIEQFIKTTGSWTPAKDKSRAEEHSFTMSFDILKHE